jgi:chemotaxis protein MotB
MAIAESADTYDRGEGENYFVSMTDMMVGMLFIFIIMLMSFAFLFRQQTDATKATQDTKIAHANVIERKLADIEKRISERLDELRQATRLRQKLLYELHDQLDAVGVKVKVDELNGVLRLTEDTIKFDFGNANLNNDAREKVKKIAPVLASVLPAYVSCTKASSLDTGCQNQTNASIETVFIEGHTDTIGRDDQNWVLSVQRAANTYRELTFRAPLLRRLHNRSDQEILSISGYSSTRPLDTGDTPDARQKNRRIDLRFVMDTDPTADLEEMQRLLQQMRIEIEKLKETP